MGWKGAMRSIGAAVRASERNAKRRQRELTLQEKHYDRMQAAEQAAHEVGVFENTVELLRSVHKECSERIDWSANLKAKEPTRPVRSDKNEKDERLKAVKYKPSFVDRLFKRIDKKKAALAERVSQAIMKDEENFKRANNGYELELKDWTQLVEISKRVLAGESKALLEAIKQLDPFSEIGTLGSEVSFTAEDGVPMHIVVRVHGKGVIPREIKSLLQSGKLSKKAMPVGRFNEIHQDYVCACVLRVAREVFAVLPVQAVIVTAKDEMLNAKTGHIEELPILSVLIPRVTLNSLNLDEIDPSDSMQNFVHVMGFKKTTGLSSVVPLNPQDYTIRANS